MISQKSFILRVSTLLLVIGVAYLQVKSSPQPPTSFSGIIAFANLVKLQQFGARIPGSDAHTKAAEFIQQQMTSYGWKVKMQSGQVNGIPYRNIYAFHQNEFPGVLIGTHYDSRMKADRDVNPRLQNHPVPGANDGGSSTAILIELARVLPKQTTNNIGFVFFDFEDQGNIEGYDWILGSREFVKNTSWRPNVFILLDMVGGYDQVIQPPQNSNLEIYRLIQSQASELGYGYHFIDPSTQGIIDDHVPFLEAGVKSVDLIDIIDPKWHTVTDDLENVSLPSLQRIGDTLARLLLSTALKSAY